MFFFFKKEVTTKIRDEWGVLHTVSVRQDTPRLTDEELARQLETNVITVITHRRD